MGTYVTRMEAMSSVRPDHRWGVDLFGSADDGSALALLLGRLNCPVWQHGVDLAVTSDRDNRAAAAIVIEGTEDRLGLCASLAAERPVILISERTGFDFRLASARAGVGAVLRSPVNFIELSEWLVHFGATEASGRTTSVVIVDDDWLTAELNAEILRSVGMVVDTVCDPKLALHAIEGRLPDLVLMDLQMPCVGGVELARMIRQARQFMSLPIVFLSAEKDEARQFEARLLGGDDFISKPIDPRKLISVVRMRADRARVIRSMIERDGLTGLFDHRHFKERLSQELERCRRSGVEISLAMIDIDQFKAINDLHGHAVGDVVIRALATSLLSGLRKIDIVGRYGGEEFGVILLDTDKDAARVVVDKIRDDFGRLPMSNDGEAFRATFSGGVASSRDFADMPSLLQAADEALYRAKASGRNNVQRAEAKTMRSPDPVKSPQGPRAAEGAAPIPTS